MSDQQRLFLTIAVCLGIMLVWSKFFLPERPPPRAPIAQTEGSPAPAAPGAAAAPAEAPPAPAATPALPESKTARTVPGFFEATFTSKGARLSSFSFLHPQYVVTHDDDSKTPVQMVPPELQDRLPLAVSLDKGPALLTGTEDYRLVQAAGRKIHYQWADAAGRFSVDKIFELPESGYSVGLTVRVNNHTSAAFAEKVRLSASGWQSADVEGGMFSLPNISEAMYVLGDQEERVEADDDMPSVYEDKVGVLRWAGWTDRYFLFVIRPRQPQDPSGSPSAAQVGVRADGGGRFSVAVTLPEASVPANESVEHHYAIYVGPKDMAVLQAEGDDLERSLNFGWFAPISRLLLWLLRFFQSFVGNWGLAILLLTLVVKAVLFPLTQKSFKSMKAMQKLKPKMDKLKEKHAADKERMNQELLGLYKTHKINPLSGCLPMVLQMPVWFGLYRAIYGAVDLYQAPFYFWIHDLSAADPTYIMPIALGGMTFIQQHLSPTTMDDAQQKMMKWMMPIMFGFFMISLPSGLVLYIFANSALTILQQWHIKRQDE